MTSSHQAADEQPPKVIYDLGANTGDDIAYYLKKADKVVAVEANPTLAKQIESKYSAAISEGRLFVENCSSIPRLHKWSKGLVSAALSKYPASFQKTMLEINPAPAEMCLPSCINSSASNVV